MMMTGRLGILALTRASKSTPDTPGMRMSLTSTMGAESSSAFSTDSASSKSLHSMPALESARESTHRMA